MQKKLLSLKKIHQVKILSSRKIHKKIKKELIKIKMLNKDQMLTKIKYYLKKFRKKYQTNKL